ncbi:MC25A protein, partial [Atrichornis clamosus]|nr:MC25A protein [Atrichornis clamosus]
MGGSESSHGGRKVSFGLDERDQVRVLQGIRLTEDVVNRMKESSQGKRDNQRSPRASNGSAPSSLAVRGRPKSTGTVGVVLPLGVMEYACIFSTILLYEQEQALVQEELLRLAKREREAANEARERNSINEERQRTAQLPVDLDAWAVELQGREAELKRQEAFYKEQLARIEKK